MKFELEYRENGEKKIKEINIDFVSNSMIRRYAKVIQDATEVSVHYTNVQDNENKIIALKSLNTKEKDKEVIKNNKEQIRELKEENQRLVALIKGTGESDYFERKLQIAKDLLEQNSEHDEKFLSSEFWDNCVDATQMTKFLHNIIHKDVPKKKMG